MLQEQIRPMLVEQFGLEENTADLLLNFVLAGILFVYRSWFLEGRRRSPQEITAVVSTLCVHGASGMLATGADR